MIHPPIDKLLERIDSKYALVIVAAKRARQLNTYHHQLGEGNIDTFAPPMVESRSPPLSLRDARPHCRSSPWAACKLDATRSS